MKRNLLLILAFALCLGCMAQTTIQMEEYNGVYRIPCTVNGAKMKFIFDTGASQVCLSMTMAEYLLDNDFITADDIIGNGSTTVADGRIVNHVKINIRDLEIQGNHLYNVPAVVIEGQNAPLLMGQSAIQKLGAIVINGNTMIIQNGNASDDDDYCDRLINEGIEAEDNGLYERAAEKLGQAYERGCLSDYGKYRYAKDCYFSEGERMEQCRKSEAILNTITDFKYFEEEEIDIYGFIGGIKSSLDKREEAIR
ncbi:MAG: retropepsin-like aspartic protease, partial [Alloprevotella sp.]|nr:retropepsin-like aspartic protease [Alloprevotella sp.]